MKSDKRLIWRATPSYASGEIVERGLVEIFSDQVLDLLMQTAAEIEFVVTGDFDTLHDVAGIDVDDWSDLSGSDGAGQ